MNKKLIESAKESLKRAYAPYSKYYVGASVEDEKGNIYTGCNIENISYGATMCAERVAIFNAISNGSKKIKKIVIVSSGNIPYPCGMCRQIMSEFMDKDGIVILEHNDKIESYSLDEIMPYIFKL